MITDIQDLRQEVAILQLDPTIKFMGKAKIPKE